jgi:RNA polymerase sigma-70 factor (ECF subfamily)
MNGDITQLRSALIPTHVATDHRWNAKEEPSDTDLVERIASGNKLALRLLYSRHNARLYRFASRLLGDKSAAEDLVNELFFEVWRTAGKFARQSQVSTWLMAIVRNKAHGLLSRRRTEQLDEEAAALIQDPADDPEAATQRKEAGIIMRRCLEQLSPAHREVLDLVYYHEKTVSDVAEIVGIPQNTVKTRMFYARRHLAELLSARGITRH